MRDRLYLIQRFVLVRQLAIEKLSKCDDHPLKDNLTKFEENIVKIKGKYDKVFIKNRFFQNFFIYTSFLKNPGQKTTKNIFIILQLKMSTYKTKMEKI